MAPFWRRREARADGPPARSGPGAAEPAKDGGSILAEHAEEGFILVEEGRVRWLNPAARLLFPTVEEPVGRPLVEVVRDHRIDLAAARAGESGFEQSIQVEVPPSGRRLQVRALPGSRQIALLVQDVTRLRHLEDVRQQFVANLSHEMRTPLAGLDLAAQTLSSLLPGDGDARVFLERIIQEAQRLEAILHNLNQLAALDAEGIEMEMVPFSVAELVTRLVERYQPRADAGGIVLRTDGLDGDLLILGDRAKAEQALQNILDNALKFTLAGEVVVSIVAHDARVEIVVRDTGPGIPRRDLPRIFERFYKVDRSRGGQPGSGLGLSIARHLVELQGGTISADSRPGVGTEMRVRLPRALISP
jgi:two-component system phosphate regulon sensor histidine kinase PhoR